MPLSDHNKQQAILSTDHLAVGYRIGKRTNIILDRINVTLKKGELVCLLGENGIGKSTLLRTLSKVIPPISGKIMLDQMALEQYNSKQLAQSISLVLTNLQRPAMLKVEEIVALGRYPFTGWGGGLKTQDMEKILWAMEMTHTTYLKDEMAGTLSDGQMQKVMIARALAQDSDVMILDEPTAHLDITNRLELMHLLKTLAKETNKAILVSTHDLDLAFHNADQLWLATCCLPIVTGCPEELVLNGEVASLFDSNTFKFDYQQGRFTSIAKSSYTITLSGEDKYYHWTKKGLERLGFGVVENGGMAQISILNGEKNKKIWQCDYDGKRDEFENISMLFEFLNENKSGFFEH